MATIVGQQSGRESITWFLAGFLLATTWIFLFIGGLILGVILVALLLVALPGILLVAGLVRLVSLTEHKIARPVAKERIEAPALVGVRILEASGICSQGMQYVVGAVYQFANGKPSPEMCGPITHALLPAVRLVRQGQPATSVKVQCPLSGYALSLEVYRKEGQLLWNSKILKGG